VLTIKNGPLVVLSLVQLPSSTHLSLAHRGVDCCTSGESLPTGGSLMFTPKQYRTKAAEYTNLAKTASNPAEAHEFQTLERSFTTLADNEQWLADNHDKTVHSSTKNGSSGDETPTAQDEHVLRCLGAALIMQWDTLPQKLQRELFDNASSMGELLDTVSLRGQIARFLHRHKEGRPGNPPPPVSGR
jgi:hypothetical protein